MTSGGAVGESSEEEDRLVEIVYKKKNEPKSSYIK